MVWIDASQVWVDAFELTRLTIEKTGYLRSIARRRFIRVTFLRLAKLDQERFDDGFWVNVNDFGRLHNADSRRLSRCAREIQIGTSHGHGARHPGARPVR